MQSGSKFCDEKCYFCFFVAEHCPTLFNKSKDSQRINNFIELVLKLIHFRLYMLFHKLLEAHIYLNHMTRFCQVIALPNAKPRLSPASYEKMRPHS